MADRESSFTRQCARLGILIYQTVCRPGILHLPDSVPTGNLGYQTVCRPGILNYQTVGADWESSVTRQHADWESLIYQTANRSSQHDDGQGNQSSTPDQADSSNQTVRRLVIVNHADSVRAGSPIYQAGADGAAPSELTQGSAPTRLSPNQGGGQAGNPIVGNAQANNPNQSAAQAGSLNEGSGPLTAPHNGGLVGNPNQGSVPFVSQHGGDHGSHGNPGDDSPQEADDLLAEWLPIDLKALDRAIEHYLGQIDAMGDTLADLLGSDRVWIGLAGAMIASATGAMAYRWERRSRSSPVSLVNGEGTITPWFLESISRG